MKSDDPSNEVADQAPGAEPGGLERYEIRVAGRLAERWGSWFDGFTLVAEDDGTTVIRGAVIDQAALHGLLQKLRDLGITLLSLTRSAPNEPFEVPASPTVHPNNPPGATS